MVDFKVRFQELLRTFNIKQVDVCKKTKIAKSTLSMYVNGTREPRQDNVIIIAEAYGVSPEWLMGFDYPMFGKVDKESAEIDFDLIDKFHLLNETNQQIILDHIEFLLEKQKK